MFKTLLKVTVVFRTFIETHSHDLPLLLELDANKATYSKAIKHRHKQ